MMRLGPRLVGQGLRPYVIAEAGVNHEGSLEKAKLLVELAAEGGADAIKFQTYKAEKLASRHSPAYWDRTKEPASSQFELFKRYDAFGPAEYRELARYAARKDIAFLSTPFDDDAVVLLNELVQVFKIASADITNYPLLRQIGRTGKPVLMSVGAATMAEIRSAIGELARAGCPDVALLHCVLNYPCDYANANLGRIRMLQSVFPNHVIGYSDHTVPDEFMTLLVVAVAMGACIVEKHFTFDKTLPGNDHYHAMNVDDLKKFIAQLAPLEQSGQLLTSDYLPAEEPARLHARRSLVAARDIRAGELLQEDALIPKRPAHGISPQFIDQVVGKTVKVDIPRDAILQWDMLAERPPTDTGPLDMVHPAE